MSVLLSKGQAKRMNIVSKHCSNNVGLFCIPCWAMFDQHFWQISDNNVSVH